MDTIVSVFQFLGHFIDGVAEVLGVSPVWVAFITGGVVISLILGVIGRIRFQMGVWNHTAQAAFQPQQAHTTQTPHQVVQASQAAQRRLTCCQFLVWFGIVGLVVAYLVSTLGPAAVFAWVQEVLLGILGS